MNEKYLQKIARVVSTIFIPPSFTLISFIYLSLTFENNSDRKIIVIAIAAVFGFILQIISFIYFYKKGLISDVDAKIKKERSIPFYVSILLFVVGLILLILNKASNISIAFWFCYISNGLFVILINKYLKISIHTMGVAGPLALFTYVCGVSAVLFLPLVAAIGWSRIKLNCHSLREVIVGAFVGFFSVYLQLIIFL